MILVTGGTGLVGSHLLYKLASSHEKIKAIYRDGNSLKQVQNVFSTYTDNYKPLFEAIEWIQADILNIPSLTEAFKDVSYVYHCAALVSFEPNKYHLLRKVNIEGTANIVNFCISNEIKKLCYVSSVATLGQAINKEAITEETIWNPETDNNVYAITKYGAEMEVWRASQEGLDVVIVNPSVILGAGMWDNGSGSLFKKAHTGLKYYTSGTISLVSVEDVVCCMIALLKSDIVNERFILVSENWTLKKFLQTMARSVNKTPPKKLATAWLLEIIWRLDWLKHIVTGKPRELTKKLSQSLSTETFYSNNKIKTALNFEFESVEKTITQVGNLFLKEV
ncbi:NAD-dependent epimerase/dehydratase family protein [Confluentibacter sediminis]|uniref:NAD-dependent epimerase/dehydratase family protein n=1 Tax=Confluentibacter sediminis TaxID=2219045 RepID=UPI000DABA469|nr:NAD-dependent epimerase/dehydratase family protein [Confluentibacter sediminis]